jgi:tRNA threonylcarbamoyl adenosine modification protein (Sua5/YciO/YrdC/YwlC family)
MTQYFTIHPENPQSRLIGQAVLILRQGGIIVYPTDSCYALGCMLDNKPALDRIARLRRLEPKHNMTLLCRDLSEIGVYAKVNNSAFRFIKRLTPGPYTFLLKATRDVPRRLQHPQKKTIGLRVPDNHIVLQILETLDAPMLSTSLVLPGNELPESDPEEIHRKLEEQVDLVIDGGAGGLEPTSVIDLCGPVPVIVRKGRGELSGITE